MEVEIEDAEMDVAGVGKSLFMAKNSTPDCDGFDGAIEFSVSIGSMENDIVDDAPQMLFDHNGDYFEEV